MTEMRNIGNPSEKEPLGKVVSQMPNSSEPIPANKHNRLIHSFAPLCANVR